MVRGLLYAPLSIRLTAFKSGYGDKETMLAALLEAKDKP
jgi:hypothetical protein